MELENLTEFSVAMVTWCARAGDYRLTLVVKAGFEMMSDGGLRPLDEPPLPLGDFPLPKGPDDISELEHASDVVPYKPLGEVLLRGTAYAPADASARPALRAELQIGDWNKSLAVFGPRRFQRGIVSQPITEPEPISQMPLRYANAFGGPDEPRNPVGKGTRGDALPNIEYLDAPINSPTDRPPPAGFGPLSPNWQPRVRCLGTYGGEYLDSHWPGFPDDFDWRFFNAAPPDQRFPGFLRGDEPVTLTGLDPEHGLHRTQLPGLRVVALREDKEGDTQFLPMHLDTLAIDADASTLELVWRGVTSVVDFEARDIERLAILSERLDEPWQALSDYQHVVEDAIAAREAVFEPEAPAAPTTESPASHPTQEQPEELAAGGLTDELAEQIDALRRANTASEAESAQQTPPLDPEVEAEAERLLADIADRERGEAEANESHRWTREQVIAATDASEPLTGADLRGLDLSHHAFGAADFRGARLDGSDFTGAELTNAAFRGCPLRAARLEGAILRRGDLSDTDLSEAVLRDADLSGARLCRAVLNGAAMERGQLAHTDCTNVTFRDATMNGCRLTGAVAMAADFTGAVIRGAALDGCAAVAAVFSRADLIDAEMPGANLQEALLSQARLARANLQGARLNAADATAAELTGADLREADLGEAVFTGADLRSARADDAAAANSDFTDAVLTQASFRRASLAGACLSSAQADAAVFSGADCTETQLDGLSARGADFSGACITQWRATDGADLRGANLRGATGAEAVFEGATVADACFAYADLPGANFVQTAAANADFTAADLRSANFTLARCERARFQSANLFEGILEGTDCGRAVFRAANCYGVDFLDSRLSGADMQETNLAMTQFAAPP
ncbi:DUF2169 domain-containing protein [Arhodomonas sp. SL1]|uniref:DUF2169 family type VI secretion system accessory protein n=1 Tax=Arhodomonas sp. SL1 TaxID=3425691 RepID=UPI003F881135